MGHYRIIQHYGYYGMFAGLDVEAGLSHFGAEVFGVVFQFIAELGSFGKHIEHGNACTNNAWGYGIAE